MHASAWQRPWLESETRGGKKKKKKKRELYYNVEACNIVKLTIGDWTQSLSLRFMCASTEASSRLPDRSFPFSFVFLFFFPFSSHHCTRKYGYNNVTLIRDSPMSAIILHARPCCIAFGEKICVSSASSHSHLAGRWAEGGRGKRGFFLSFFFADDRELHVSKGQACNITARVSFLATRVTLRIIRTRSNGKSSSEGGSAISLDCYETRSRFSVPPWYEQRGEQAKKKRGFYHFIYIFQRHALFFSISLYISFYFCLMLLRDL